MSLFSLSQQREAVNVLKTSELKPVHGNRLPLGLMQETQGQQSNWRSKTMSLQCLSKPVIVSVTQTKHFRDIRPLTLDTEHRIPAVHLRENRPLAPLSCLTSPSLFYVPVASIYSSSFSLLLFFFLHVCFIGNWFSLSLLNSFICVFSKWICISPGAVWDSLA